MYKEEQKRVHNFITKWGRVTRGQGPRWEDNTQVNKIEIQ
jgi:hypothetical protein